MARKSVAVTVQQVLANGVAVVTKVSRPADIMNGATTATDQATLVAAIATAVADGASPTEAHVTDIDTAYTALAADIAGVPSISSDVVLSYNTTSVTTKSTLRQAVEALLASLPETL